MRAVAVAVIAIALGSSAWAAPKKSLAEFCPPSLNGIPLSKLPKDMVPPPPDAVASYLDRKARKSININLFRVKDLKSSKAMFHHLKPGETKTNDVIHMSFKGFELDGVTGELDNYLDDNRSEANLLLADKLDVRVSVQPADSDDEVIEVLKQLDLAALNAFAKTMK